MFYTRLVFARHLIFFLFGLVFICMSISQASAQENCSAEMNSRAVFLLIGARKEWTSLMEHQQVFASCDDGELGENYSDAVVHLFAQRWDQFGMFIVIAKKHQDFKRWAIRHVDATASDESLKKIVLNVKACSNDAEAASLCKAIQRAAASALAESANTTVNEK